MKKQRKNLEKGMEKIIYNMKLYSKNKNYKLYQGSMLDMLEIIEPNTIDSIVCDPPYELNFMNKGWDNSGIAFNKETWAKCYEVLKPGGYLLSFGGSRTFHRIACAIEDAGFEIRDTIMWLYGSGSTGKAVMYENKDRQVNYKYIGIEITEEYLPIAKARIEYIQKLQEQKERQLNIFDYE